MVGSESTESGRIQCYDYSATAILAEMLWHWRPTPIAILC